MSGPYGEHANDLVSAGWRGVLPLPVAAKSPPPNGYTGAGGAWPSGADVWTWSEELPNANIGLRLPPGVIGLDVDAYAGKTGADTLSAHEQKFGALPATWTVTSRTDGVSGIRLYRVPPGLWWPGDLGGGLEVIQTKHRYVVAPPSIHPEGRTYRWAHPDLHPDIGNAVPPTPDSLTALPHAWVSGLTGGRAAVDIGKSAPAGPEVATWYTSANNNAEPCGVVRTTIARGLAELRDAAGSRHDTGMRTVMRLCYLSAEGHRGVVASIDVFRQAWHRAITSGASARDDAAADHEWRRIMSGALAILAADGALGTCDIDDPCANPFDGILIPDGVDVPEQYRAQYDPVTDRWTAADGRTLGAAAPDDDDAARREATARLVEIEATKLKIRREAKELLAQWESEKFWTSPPSLDTLADELDLPDEELSYRVASLIPTGGNVVVTAAFKSGKTTLVNDLVRCLVDGQPFLGRYGVEQITDGSVALWNYEVGAGQYRRWLRDLGIVRTRHVSVLNLRGFTMPLRSRYVRAWAVDWLRSRKVRVWVVDPFARAFLGNGESENSNTEVGLFLETLDQIKEEAGIHELILPTHTGRATMDIGTERSRGATRIDDWADVRWILTKDADGNRFFRATGRDVETPEGRLEYDADNRSLTITDEQREEPENDRRGRGRPIESTTEEIVNAVLAIVDLHPGIGFRQIQSYVRNQLGSCSQPRLQDAIGELAAAGRLAVRVGGNGVTTAHYPAL